MSLPQALELLRAAEASWFDAVEAHIRAEPNPGFAGRLRDFAAACESQRAAFQYAADEGLEWNPLPPGPDRPPPYELTGTSGRVGPLELWAQFDVAYQRWDTALEAKSMQAIADGFGAMTTAAEQLAAAVDEERGESSASRRSQAG